MYRHVESQHTSHEWRDEKWQHDGDFERRALLWFRLREVLLDRSRTYKYNKNNRHEVDQSYAGVLHVDASVDVVILFSAQQTAHGGRFQGDIKADFCAEDFKKQLQ